MSKKRGPHGLIGSRTGGAERQRDCSGRHVQRPCAVAVSAALGLAAAGAVLFVAPVARAAPAAQPQQSSAAATQTAPKKLQAVVVTGSLIRRVAIETASPVVHVDRAAITAAGSPTLGNVIQELPSVTGYSTNGANNNNGGDNTGPGLEGGDGAARVSLRGLGSSRTLMLINGFRMVNPDLNMLPQSMIQRVNVLTEGASTVYGSDAIGGVVNFSLRQHFSGVELDLYDGITSHGDGQRHSANLTLGKNGQNYNIAGGAGFNKYYGIGASRRIWSKNALYLSNGVPRPTGSTTNPTGHIQLPGRFASRYGCTVKGNGTIFVTRDHGDGSSLDDYRCYKASDAYNYEAFNYIEVPQKRYNGFLLGHYDLTNNVTAYFDAFYDHTQAVSSNAANTVGVSAGPEGFSIAADNPINPFGVTFSRGIIPGQPNSGFAYNVRLTSAGLRLQKFTTHTGHVDGGLRGAFGQSSWTWNIAFNYGHTERTLINTAQVIRPKLNEVVANGANIFDQASQAKAFAGVVTNSRYVDIHWLKGAKLLVGGNLLQLPAGTVQLSMGAAWRKKYMSRTVPPRAILNIKTLSCAVGSCDADASGSENVKEAYGEMLIPLLSKVPGAYSLNVDLGIRTSKYNTVGTTTNEKIAIEWRPIRDLLVRGTISKVFRAPSLDDLYDGPHSGGPTLNDPCLHLTAAELAQHTAACQFVPPNFSGNGNIQTTNLTIGAVRAGESLKPENGKSIDMGMVYEPHWWPGVSTSIDFWHDYLYNTLVPLNVSTIVDGCFANNNSPYCPLIVRQGHDTKQPGEVFYILTPITNLGSLSTSGIDFTFDYKIPHFDVGGVNIGDFRASFAGTYTSTFKNDATPGQPGAHTVDYAGSYTAQFGGIPRWRTTIKFNWVRGNWSAGWRVRYINPVTVPHADEATLASLQVASIIYQAVHVSYNAPIIHTRFSLGINNLADKMPPLVYQNSILTNNNVDTATYDTIGRFYWVRATIKF